jgi:hypothetical protein
VILDQAQRKIGLYYIYTISIRNNNIIQQVYIKCNTYELSYIISKTRRRGRTKESILSVLCMIQHTQGVLE